MDLDTKALRGTAHFHSKSLAGLAAAVFAVSAYLFQRSANIIADLVDANGMQQSQQVWGGLDFSYVTLSIAWPLILGVLCVLFRLVYCRRHEIVELLDANGSNRALINLEDPFFLHVPPSVVANVSVFAAGLIPLAAVATSTYAVVSESGYSVLGAVQLLAGVAGVLLTMRFGVVLRSWFVRVPLKP